MLHYKLKNNRAKGKTNNFVCNHCGESGHSKRRCYEIVGFPDWWDFSKKPRKKTVGKAMETNVRGVQTSVEEKPAANLTGMSDKANVYTENSENSPWIIDTGASDHMTRNSSLIQSMRAPSHSYHIISTANGSTSEVLLGKDPSLFLIL